MKRTVILLAAMLLSAPLASCSNGKTKIGILQFGSFEALEKAKQGFVDALSKSPLAGSIEFDIKNPAADGSTNASMAATLASNSDLLYGVATPSAAALKNSLESLGSDTPLLFSAVTNPVGAKLLKNMDAPEGNCTGVVDLGPIEDELEVLSSFPGVDKIASFFTSTEVNSVYQAEIAERWMDVHGIEHIRKTITSASEIESALSSIGDDVDAIFLPTDDTIANSMPSLKSANESRTKKLLIAGSDTGVIDGCTFAMGVDYYRCGEQAGAMAIKILQDKKSISEIAVESCSQNAIFINKTWAESLGQAIPESVLSMEGATIL